VGRPDNGITPLAALGFKALLKLSEQKTQYAGANSSDITMYLSEQTIARSQYMYSYTQRAMDLQTQYAGANRV
jgi:hypothetical protein